jgi:hypothetical protein
MSTMDVGIRNQYANRPALLERLDRANLTSGI